MGPHSICVCMPVCVFLYSTVSVYTLTYYVGIPQEAVNPDLVGPAPAMLKAAV